MEEVEEPDLVSELRLVGPQLAEALSRVSDGDLDRIMCLLRTAGQQQLRLIPDRTRRVSQMVDLFLGETAATCRRFIHAVCLFCALPLALETQLMSAAGEEPPDRNRKRRQEGSFPPVPEKHPCIVSPEMYKSTMKRLLLQRYQRVSQGVRRLVRLHETCVSLVNRNTVKLKERVDRLWGDTPGLQDSDDGVDRVVKIMDLLQPSTTSQSRVIVLLGSAGTGKTLLMHCVGHHWAQGAFDSFQFFFLFEFRQLNLIKRTLSLQQLLFEFFLQPEVGERDSMFDVILANPRSVCVVFDGYDEFCCKFTALRRDTPVDPRRPLHMAELFSSLYTGRMLQGCTLVVTCRPKDVMDLPLGAVDEVGEVPGFDHRRVHEYAQDYFKDSPHREQVLGHLMSSRTILNMCYVPALCFISCVCLEYLLRQRSPLTSLPHTMTQFYIQIIMAFLSRRQVGHLPEGPGPPPSLLQRSRQEIEELSRLAMEGLEQSNIVFYAQDLPPAVLKFASDSGFFSRFEVKKEDGSEGMGCAFVHLTMQEFFAALHLMTSEVVQEAQLKKKFNLKSRWTTKTDPKTVFTDTYHLYVSGLASRDCASFLGQLSRHSAAWVEKRQSAILKILRSLATGTLTGPKLVELCRCAYETQDDNLAALVGNRSRYELRNFRISPVDMIALAFVINNAKKQVCLDIAGCSVEPDCLDILPTCNYIDSLIFRSRKYDDRFAEALSDILPRVERLQKLEFVSGSIGEGGVANLARALQSCPHLTELNLSDNFLTDSGISLIANTFPMLKTIQSVNLGNNTCTVDGIINLVKTMSSCLHIQEIHVNGTKEAKVLFYMDSDTQSSAEAQRRRRTGAGRTLSLLNCTLTPKDMKNLCELLTRCPGLSDVNLSGNLLKDPAFRVLGDFLPQVSVSGRISICNNTISVEGMCCLARALTLCPRTEALEISLQQGSQIIVKFAGEPQKGGGYPGVEDSTGQQLPVVSKRLQLTNCNIQPGHLDRLLKTLKGCDSLELLDLSGNALGNRGLKKLLDALPTLRGIREIDASDGKVTMEGVIWLADSLGSCRDMSDVDASCGGSKRLIIRFHRSASRPVGIPPAETGPQGNGHGVCKTLRLCSSAIQSAAMDKLCARLTRCLSLSELDFSDNNLDEASIEKLLKHLPQMQELKLLNISNSRISTDGALLLVRSLIDCERVREVELRPQGEAFIKFVKVKAEQATCRLNQYNLDRKNVENLSGILEKCSRLAEVDLSSNVLEDEGVGCFLQSLPRLHISRAINLNNNRLSQLGVLYLVNSMSVCQRVVEIEVCLGTEEKSLIRFMQDEDEHQGVRSIVQDSHSVYETKAHCTIARRISLRECSFTKEHLAKLADILDKCAQLVKLEMCDNTLHSEGLQTLKNTLARLGSLQRLEIRNNGISREVIVNLVQELRNCPKMLSLRVRESWITAGEAAVLVSQCLDLNHNIQEIRVNRNTLHITMGSCPPCTEQERDFPRDGGLGGPSSTSAVKSLSFVDCGLQGHHLSFLQEVSQHCPQLQELDLSHNSIGAEGAKTLLSVLPAFTHLKKLSLESKQTTECEIHLLAIGLNCCSNIQSLNFSHNKIGDEGAKALARVLPTLRHLKGINFSHCCCLTPMVGFQLVQGLCQCPALEELNLDSVQLDDRGMACLAAGLGRMASVKRLTLNKITSSPEEGSQAVLGVLGSMRTWRGIEEIALNEIRMGDKGILELACHIPAWDRLRKISLSENKIGETGGVRLTEALVGCRLLEEINLARNSIGDTTAGKLSEVLPAMPRLRVLILQSNRIGPMGGACLSQVFPACKNLEEISLAENIIGRDGAVSLSDALVQIKSLKKLDLKLTELSPDGSVRLAGSLGHCVRVEEVNLSWNSIGDDSAHKLAEVLPRCQRLRSLDLERNAITIIGAEAIAARLKSCSSIEVIRLWGNKINKDDFPYLQEKDPRLNFSSC
ncbi:protein NLRC5 isoform X2 [Amia ocellicauda]|uniref:protein NLRC5 isoform X2 n=1 Tax=Amia ocellicauda TaxID=2972642 RepID=UPI0034643B0C